MTWDRGYRALDLAASWNAPLTLLDDVDASFTGERRLYGLPFRFGDDLAGPSLLRVDGDGTAIPVDEEFEWVLFAHALEQPDLFEGAPVGETVARYTLRYADGTAETVPVRQRFEIGPTPRLWEGRPIPLDWGQTPFLALPDAQHRLMHRTCGRYDAAGARFVDIDDPQARSPYVLPYRFYLWPWRNPHPGRRVAAIEIASAGPSVLVGAVTLSRLAEDPFGRTVSRELVFSLAEGSVDEDVAVVVDRGTATYAYRTVDDASLSTPPGWGGSTDPRTGYVRVAATPSATVSLEVGGTVTAAFTWGDILDRGELTTADGTGWRLPGAGRAWIKGTIVDDATGEPLTCRLHFHTPDGVPLAPYGHHAHINSDGNTWNLDIGGDVRLGQRTYAYVDGEFEGWLPHGRVIVEAAHGFDYVPLREEVTISPGQRTLELRLKPFHDPEADGYAAGDTHVHFVSTHGAELEARGEGVRVTNLLMSQWGHLYTNTEDFTGHPHTSVDGRTHVFAGQENRTAMLGHINLLGLRTQVRPWTTGGAEEADLGGGLETTLAHWADECHAQGGTVVLAHFPVPNGEAAALIATGRLDGVEMIAYDDYNIAQYYRYLNAGYRLTLVGGTDKMSSEVPIGLVRTYARVPDPATMDYWDWCAAVRSGDTVVTSGPHLRLSVDGAAPGAVLTGAGTVRGTAEFHSIFPVDRLEIVVNGGVVDSRRWDEPVETGTLDFDLAVGESSWVAARCYGPGDGIARHRDVWERPIMAHTSPVYVAPGDAYERTDEAVLREMLHLIEGVEQHIRDRARTDWPGPADHRHGQADHDRFLLAPLDEARETILRRLPRDA
ncbi:CehA/McbA family metallohydrolase [Actinomadura bangladeshensis]|uniref:CehA/McbA family metallohydrolase n=1 Tax=Actinomadura bangladeshensis TaxID=453573 RepID=A0A6L9QIN1_9ACTN|nr:CehA/McbA family metallohydrolase [Actinomadura bangladeshensis]NEA25371.1 CehA/McbA family metallohydrolase [Actinomadura bangladeshensis]